MERLETGEVVEIQRYSPVAGNLWSLSVSQSGTAWALDQSSGSLVKFDDLGTPLETVLVSAVSGPTNPGRMPAGAWEDEAGVWRVSHVPEPDSEGASSPDDVFDTVIELLDPATLGGLSRFVDDRLLVPVKGATMLRHTRSNAQGLLEIALYSLAYDREQPSSR
jgi:hypothetical protein